jgi:hypothetical protein
MNLAAVLNRNEVEAEMSLADFAYVAPHTTAIAAPALAA